MTTPLLMSAPAAMTWREQLRIGVSTMIGRSYPRIVSAAREPDWIFYEVALPMLRVLAFGIVYQSLGRPQYTSFVVLGGAMIAFWANVLWSMAGQLHWERQSGNLELYLMAPASMLWILAGMALGGMLSTLFRSLVILLLGSLIFHVTYQIVSAPLLIIVFLLTLVALYGLGSMLASLYLLYNREVWAIQEVIQEPISLVTGFYFPVKALGGFVGGLASIIPLTLGMDAMRQLLFPQLGQAFLSVPVEIAVLAVLTVLFLVGAVVSFNYIERLAKIEGRLSLKWQ